MALDVDRFLRGGGPRWRALEQLLAEMEPSGGRVASLDAWQRLAGLYRRVASDSILAQQAGMDPALLDALNGLVARSHALLHGPTPRALRARVRVQGLLVGGLRATLRRRRRLLGLAVAVLLLGVLIGALATVADPRAVAAFVPEAFAHEPTERVRHDASAGLSALGRTPLGAAAFLFTHNLKVTLLLFGLGLSWGLGVLALLFYNGLLIGAMGADYAAAGHLTFFFAWVAPHGVPELAAVVLGGTAGLSLSAALWAPGPAGRGEAMRRAARDGLLLLLGAVPWLLVAAALEGTLSQIPPSRLPLWVKGGVVAVTGLGLLLHWRGVGGAGSGSGGASAASEEAA